MFLVPYFLFAYSVGVHERSALFALGYLISAGALGFAALVPEASAGDLAFSAGAGVLLAVLDWLVMAVLLPREYGRATFARHWVLLGVTGWRIVRSGAVALLLVAQFVAFASILWLFATSNVLWPFRLATTLSVITLIAIVYDTNIAPQMRLAHNLANKAQCVYRHGATYLVFVAVLSIQAICLQTAEANGWFLIGLAILGVISVPLAVYITSRIRTHTTTSSHKRA